jgi:hypothetical protein
MTPMFRTYYRDSGTVHYLRFCGLLVKGEASIDLSGDTTGDDFEDLLAKFDKLLMSELIGSNCKDK